MNVLIALVDADHLSHGTVRKWFLRNHESGWATCPITENGMVRVLSQPKYQSGQRTPAEVVDTLNALKSAFADSYQFWTDDVSLSDSSRFDPALIAGTKQVTDVYLLGLAARHKGALVSLDRSLAWSAVRDGSGRLVKHPG